MSEQAEVIETLSKRELEVAAAYANGASYKEIARDLGISPTTVRSHLRTVYGKLNVTSKIALAQMLADPASNGAPVADNNLAADLALELDEAIRRERAMARVLRIISESDASIEEVIDEVLDHALEICEAEFGILMEHHGDYTFTEMRSRNISPAFAKWLSEQGMFNPGQETAIGRSARILQPISIADVSGEGISWDENPLRMATVEYGRARSLAAIPMTAGGRLIGVFSVYRTRVHPFNERSLELAQTFADQAAIAIENTRQFAAMEARLTQSSATREILDAISGSRSDEKPVFDLILSRARDLCAADAAALTLGRDGDEAQTLAAAIDMHPTTRALYAAGKVKMNPKTSIVAEAIVSGQIRHVADYAETDGYKDGDKVFASLVDDTGMRTSLIVPLTSEEAGIGALVLYRREPRAYTPDQIKLVETFAAQAVIAVENVQQFRAMEARLDQAAATREILDAISNASDDEAPVFDAILGNARKLCDAPFAALVLGRETDGYQSMVAHHGAVQSTEDIYSEGRVPMDPEKSFAARAIIEKRPIHLPNMMDTDQYRAGVPNVVELCDLQGIRTNLFVPLIKDGVGIGCFIIFRHEVRPYSDEQIALVETFATQAVIALENVRQFRDLQTRLDREAATRDVLEVINENRDDALPVFEAILKKATQLCRADAGALALGARGDTHQRMATSFEVSQETIDVYDRGEVSMNPDISLAAKAIVTGEAVHVEDMAETEGYRNGVSHYVTVVDDSGIRTNLFVPLMTAEGGAGVLILFRKEVKPYSADDIALVETFAAQAAIALENVRQFREVQERLERERASAEILEVISRSRDDERPVFDAILENAARLCGAPISGLVLLNEPGDTLIVQRVWGDDESRLKLPLNGFAVDSDVFPARTFRSAETLHIPDIRQLPEYIAGNPRYLALVEERGFHSYLCVPLLLNGEPIGCIDLFRTEATPFSDRQVALVETFAAQAVIAIQNVRQFREVQERLERERASAEILEIISRSRDDDHPVFDVIVKSVSRLCNAPLAYLSVLNEERTHVTIPAQIGAGADFGAALARFEETVEKDWLFVIKSAIDREVIRFDDLAESDLYKSGNEYRKKMVDEESMRSVLCVPLESGGVGYGCLVLYRREVAPFTDEDVELVRGFAAQAVIAIQNVRQFREVQERLERERASAEILQVISQSRDDDKPVFDAILKNASVLCNAQQAALILGAAQDSAQTLAAQTNVAPAAIELFETGQMAMDGDVSYAARSIIEARLVAFDDMRDSDLYTAGSPVVRSMVDDSGIRSVLFAPLIKDGVAIGNITLFRYAVDPFSEFEISLIETFAAQAVIAIQNVRQFREVQERLEREAATKDILQVISRSRDDDLPVFDIILENAARLCDAPVAALALANSDRTHLRIAAYRGAQSDFLRSDAEPWPLDAPIFVAKAVLDNEIIHVEDLADDALYPGRHPVREIAVNDEGVRSFLVVPLVIDGVAIGAIGLYRREKRKFSDPDVELVKTFAAQASIAIENVSQFKALETLNAELGDRVEDQVGEIERMGRLKRFLPSAVADAVVTSGDESMLRSHRAMVATLFCDMRGFTAFCEAAEPEETIEVLQTYHQEMSDLIDEYGGGVDQRAGDGIMVIFNDPIPVEDPAGDAVRLAIAMRAKMKELCAGWKRLGYRLGFGVGISLGYATVGMVGSAGRFDYTASGTSVNTAARLCDMATDGEVLISPRVWVAVEGDFQADSRGEVEMKGIREPVEVFAVA